MRLEEERERELAREMMGVTNEEMSSGINFKPSTQEEFDALRNVCNYRAKSSHSRTYMFFVIKYNRGIWCILASKQNPHFLLKVSLSLQTY